jgi:hypothetical protein
MKKTQTSKLQLSKDTLRHLENVPLDQVKGMQPTTTVQTRFPSCTAC